MPGPTPAESRQASEVIDRALTLRVLDVAGLERRLGVAGIPRALTRGSATPPSSPAPVAGDMHLLSDDRLAHRRSDSAWEYFVPTAACAWKVFVASEAREYTWNGEAWFADDAAARGLRETSGPTVLTLGAVADGEYLRRVGAELVGATPSGGGGTTDHGALTGLGDDDHAQYSLANGSRPFTSTVSGVTPSASAHLTTKGYVDTADTANAAAAAAAQSDADAAQADADAAQADIDAHAALTNNPHSVTAAQVGAPPTTRTITAGTGLTGGGDLSANRTLAVAYGSSSGTAAEGNDSRFAANAAAAAAAQATADAAIPLAQKAAANGVATLDSGGKIPSSQLPAVALTDTFVVASQAAMLALTAEHGDVAVRTDLNKSFILTAEPATVLGNWQELLTPTDAVSSVAGRTGAVTLAAGDISDSTSAGRALLTAADAAAQRAALALVPGTDVQAQDAELAAIAGLTSAADRAPYFTGLGTAALAVLTSFGRSLIAAADAAAARVLLALDNVTNDAQLKRSGADWTGFASKATPVSGDVILIEDSEASGAKKTITVGNLPSGGGGVSDGDKGDITVSASGATWTIDARAVSFAKLAAIATARFLGRLTASSGDVEELTAQQMRTALAMGLMRAPQVLTSGTTHNLPTGCRRFRVRLKAGGGGGGGTTNTTSQAAYGGGGAEGGRAEKTWDVADPSNPGSITYAIGAAGSAGSTSGGTGGTGGDTTATFDGTTVTAKGGLGGVGQTAGTSPGYAAGGANGGISTNGDLNEAGAPGAWSLRVGSALGASGAGGGPGGGVGRTTAGAGNDGIGFGSGGGGGANTGASAQPGGAGAAGVMVVEEFA